MKMLEEASRTHSIHFSLSQCPVRRDETTLCANGTGFERWAPSPPKQQRHCEETALLRDQNNPGSSSSYSSPIVIAQHTSFFLIPFRPINPDTHSLEQHQPPALIPEAISLRESDAIFGWLGAGDGGDGVCNGSGLGACVGVWVDASSSWRFFFAFLTPLEYGGRPALLLLGSIYVIVDYEGEMLFPTSFCPRGKAWILSWWW